MKREVASSLVERGVTERVRLSKAYENKRDELLKQHELVKTALNDHRSKVSNQIIMGVFESAKKFANSAILIFPQHNPEVI